MILPPKTPLTDLQPSAALPTDATELLLAKDRQLAEQRDVIDRKSEVIRSQSVRIKILEEQLKLQKIKRFGSSSEQSPDQGDLFNEVELLAEAAPAVEDVDTETETVEKKKKPTGRKGLNPDLPRIQERHALSDAEKAGAIDTFWVKTKEVLDIVPAKAQVIEIMQEKAVFLDENNERSVIAAELPLHPLGKAIASVNTLVYIIIAKYQDALPLYRIEKQLDRFGGGITRTTQANWLIKLSDQLIPLINLLREQQWQGNLIQMDETRVQVLKELGREATSDKWMWVSRGGPPGQPSVIFEYDASRSREVPLRLLDGYSGKLQTDGCPSYNAVVAENKLIHIGCWDHARRKFDEALKAATPVKKKTKKATSTAPSKAQIGFSKINKLYVVEREIKELSEAERHHARQTRSKPLLEDLKAWLEANQHKVPKDSLTSIAIHYALNQWDKLVRYIDDGSTPISNILAENAIRPFCVGRRNWLFSDTPKGAKASALYYSLIETAKANGIEPYHYLQKILTKLPYADTVEKYEALLPWNLKNEM